jgi:magnesium chelatase family protein
MHRQVIKAFRRQKERGQVRLNGKLNEEEIEIYCRLDNASLPVLENAIQRFGLSHRSIASIKKIARTIADINDNEEITKKDLLEALSYRRRK